ncbi:Uncharacterised protein [Mycobacterium tuberculosis]|uniref:Uncharacterized protein n=1 Tax=Mycobacterium tuberculosis TaxID=1773 RepID=A0A655ANA0_MYCTX|nr:Uncharacterised protein [Mycobacterium tuberculosis]CFS10435.1 Uncharacterised protein [Mycobacterium tuberculosis]CFS18342.1 Uncharacterised protein [Mycobacterium tuberculosis]CFS30596.1 Uncharacterised protein [Mycobacterium tuberculosis]CFV44837.1 Uncharacterised protein [Mycobacterium tuberculosis]
MLPAVGGGSVASSPGPARYIGRQRVPASGHWVSSRTAVMVSRSSRTSRRTLREPEEPASASRKNFSCSDSAVAE